MGKKRYSGNLAVSPATSGVSQEIGKISLVALGVATMDSGFESAGCCGFARKNRY